MIIIRHTASYSIIIISDVATLSPIFYTHIITTFSHTLSPHYQHIITTLSPHYHQSFTETSLRMKLMLLRHPCQWQRAELRWNTFKELSFRATDVKVLNVFLDFECIPSLYHRLIFTFTHQVVDYMIPFYPDPFGLFVNMQASASGNRKTIECHMFPMFGRSAWNVKMDLEFSIPEICKNNKNKRINPGVLPSQASSSWSTFLLPFLKESWYPFHPSFFWKPFSFSLSKKP